MTRIHRSVPRGRAGFAGAVGAGALGVVLLTAGAPAPPPGQLDAAGTGRDEALQRVVTPGGPIDVGRLGDVRITLDAAQGTWTAAGAEVSLETYRTVPGDVLTYTAEIGVSADEPVLATLRASTAGTGPALVTELDIDVDGGTDLGGSTVVALEGVQTVRVSLGLTFAPTAQGQDLQGAAVDLPEIVVRTQPVGTGVIDGVVTAGGAPAVGASVLLEVAGPAGFAPVCDATAVDGRDNPVTTGTDGAFGWPVVNGTYRLTAMSGDRLAAQTVTVSDGVTGTVLALADGDVALMPAGCPPKAPAEIVPEPAEDTASGGPGAAPDGTGADRVATGPDVTGEAGERGGAVDQPGVTLVIGSSIVALVLVLSRRRQGRLTPASPSPRRVSVAVSSRPHPPNPSPRPRALMG